MKLRISALKLYIFSLAGLFLLSLIAVAFRGGFAPPSWDALVFWGGLLFFLARLTVPLPLLGQVSLHFVGALTAVFALPVGWAGLFSALALPVSRPVNPLREVFNRSQVGLGALVAGLLYQRFPSEVGVFAAGLAYFAQNLGFMLLLSWLLKGVPPVEAWRRNFAPYGLTYLLVSPTAYLMARLWDTPVLGGWGGFGVLLVVLPLVYLRHMWLLRARLEETSKRMLQSLVLTLEAKDAHTALHSERVAAIAVDVAQRLGLPEAQREVLLLGSRLHDVGKVGVPDEVLLKPGRLSEREWELMRSHPEMGFRIVEPMLGYLGPVDGIVLYHHERWDGSGYPRGLKGEEIPLLARIVAVADAYEAMTSDRPYRKAMHPRDALEVIVREAGRQFDPAVVEAFKDVWERSPAWQERSVFVQRLLEVHG